MGAVLPRDDVVGIMARQTAWVAADVSLRVHRA